MKKKKLTRTKLKKNTNLHELKIKKLTKAKLEKCKLTTTRSIF